MEGREVKRWVEESERLSKEIARVSTLLRNGLHIDLSSHYIEQKKGLNVEKNQVERRLKEFESAMDCILKYLAEGDDEEDGGSVNVFKFDGCFDWNRIHCLIRRECRRLEDGLPIYTYRTDILREIHYQQVYLSVAISIIL